MSLTFYYSPMSTAVLTNLVLEELGVPCERVTVDLKKGETHTQEFLRVNPNGKIPVLVHDGIAIWESAAITLYLGEIFGVAKGLYPRARPATGRGDEVGDLVQRHTGRCVRPLCSQHDRLVPGRATQRQGGRGRDLPTRTAVCRFSIGRSTAGNTCSRATRWPTPT